MPMGHYSHGTNVSGLYRSFIWDVDTDVGWEEEKQACRKLEYRGFLKATYVQSVAICDLVGIELKALYRGNVHTFSII